MSPESARAGTATVVGVYFMGQLVVGTMGSGSGS